MPVVQTTPRRDSHKQAATARRLLAASTIAQHVLDSTIEYQSEKSVIPCRGRKEQAPSLIGNVVLFPGDRFHLVASKFTNRYYVVIERDGTWRCSSKDSVVAARCIAQVQASLK